MVRGMQGELKLLNFMELKCERRSQAGLWMKRRSPRSFEDVPTVQLFSARDLEESLNQIREIISDPNKDWNKRVDALKKLRSLLIAGAANFDELFTHLRLLEVPFQAIVKDLRSQVVREACVTVAYLSEKLRHKFDKFAEGILPNLINLIQNSAKFFLTFSLVFMSLSLYRVIYGVPYRLPVDKIGANKRVAGGAAARPAPLLHHARYNHLGRGGYSNWTNRNSTEQGRRNHHANGYNTSYTCTKESEVTFIATTGNEESVFVGREGKWTENDVRNIRKPDISKLMKTNFSSCKPTEGKCSLAEGEDLWHKRLEHLNCKVLKQMGLPTSRKRQVYRKHLCGEAIQATACQVNRSPTAALGGNIPADIYLGIMDISKLKIFGAKAWMVKLPTQERQIGHKSYPMSDKIRISRDVKFNETDVFKDERKTDTLQFCRDVTVNNEVEGEAFHGFEEDKETALEFKRMVRKPRHFENYDLYAAYCLMTDSNPRTYQEAVGQNEEWRIAILRELDLHKKFQTCVDADSPKDLEPIETRWVFSTKPDGTKKVRLVVKGFQKNTPEGNKGFLYAPVAKVPTIRLAITYSLQKDWTVKQIDIPTAFLNGTLKEDNRLRSSRVDVWSVIWVDGILLFGENIKTEELAKLLTDFWTTQQVLYGTRQRGCYVKGAMDSNLIYEKRPEEFDKVMASAGVVTVRFLIRYTHSHRMIPIITQNMNSKSKDIRRACSEFLEQLLSSWSTHSLERHCTLLQDAIKKGIADADLEARLSSRKAYWSFRSHFPEQAEALLNSLDISYKRALNGDLTMSNSSSSNSLNQQGRYGTTPRPRFTGSATVSGSHVVLNISCTRSLPSWYTSRRVNPLPDAPFQTEVAEGVRHILLTSGKSHEYQPSLVSHITSLEPQAQALRHLQYPVAEHLSQPDQLPTPVIAYLIPPILLPPLQPKTRFIPTFSTVPVFAPISTDATPATRHPGIAKRPGAPKCRIVIPTPDFMPCREATRPVLYNVCVIVICDARLVKRRIVGPEDAVKSLGAECLRHHKCTMKTKVGADSSHGTERWGEGTRWTSVA
ncbi:hypothetical protein PR048_028802 [Dryococelus australis]|uniref:Uncharacterized protein n=1 Tax=Dryococelus australis TaxID=614101 RepID=A0ABQ9GBL2_9NEOP|nr:hypothetical protein PR048_028802 [Dryococelus australis]